MKKILAIALLTLVATTASAQHRCCYRQGHSFVPFVLGAVVGGVIVESQRPVIVTQPVIVADPSIVYINGIMYSRQIVFNNGVYQEILVQVYTVNGNYGR